MNTQVATVSELPTSLTLYDQVSDPLAFIKEMGKALALSGVAGCKSEASGQVVAWACVAKRKDPFELAARYHFIEGKLAIKAEQMLADFRTKFGGKHEWLKDGKDGKVAELRLTGPDSVVITYAFTISEAEKAGYVKDKSQWVKRPDQMLRSRCITDGIRMGWPEISAGNYSEEEIYDLDPSERPKEAVTGKVSRSKANTASQADVTSSATVVELKSETVVDAEIVPKEVVSESTTVKSEVPFDVSSKPATENKSQFQATALEIQSLTEQCGWKVSDVVAKFNQGFKTNHANIEDFTDDQQAKMLDRIREVHKANEQKKLDAKSNEPS